MSKRKYRNYNRDFKKQLTSDVPAHDVAHFLSAYTYGNILILAALLTFTPEGIEHGHGANIIVGTGFATLLAHVVAESQEIMVLRGKNESSAELMESLRKAVKNARPIMSATSVPALLLYLAQNHVLDANAAWWASLSIIIARMLRNPSAIARYRGDTVTAQTRLLSFGFAFLCVLVALIKALLTH